MYGRSRVVRGFATLETERGYGLVADEPLSVLGKGMQLAFVAWQYANWCRVGKEAVDARTTHRSRALHAARERARRNASRRGRAAVAHADAESGQSGIHVCDC